MTQAKYDTYLGNHAFLRDIGRTFVVIYREREGWFWCEDTAEGSRYHGPFATSADAYFDAQDV